ncbi:MAG TPA: nucleotidyltransferase family protein [Pseudolysinimonas sp.]|nr:nucleotidyltransferase family protein [Pseudolysinimonas sp.]
MTDATGIVLAAGAGRRHGTSKALLATPDGEPWIARAVHTLRAAGCEHVVVVLGADAEAAREFVPVGAHPVVADDWESGIAASLRAGLAAASHPSLMRDAALVTLVDLPDLPVTAVQRMLAAPITAATLRRAVYEGRLGHPIVIGRDHWDPLVHALGGQAETTEYVQAHGEFVECGDLWGGADVELSPRATTSD